MTGEWQKWVFWCQLDTNICTDGCGVCVLTLMGAIHMKIYLIFRFFLCLSALCLVHVLLLVCAQSALHVSGKNSCHIIIFYGSPCFCVVDLGLFGVCVSASHSCRRNVGRLFNAPVFRHVQMCASFDFPANSNFFRLKILQFQSENF